MLRKTPRRSCFSVRAANHRSTSFTFSVGEINQAIEKPLVELNDRPFQKVAGSRRSWFEEIDRPALKPLPPEAYEIADWRKAIVNLDYHIQVDSARDHL